MFYDFCNGLLFCSRFPGSTPSKHIVFQVTGPQLLACSNNFTCPGILELITWKWLSRCISAIKRSVITIAVPLAVQRLIFCYICDGCSHALIQIPNSSVRFLGTSQQLLSLTTLVDFFPYRWGSIWVLASQMLHHIPWNVVLKFTCCTFFGNWRSEWLEMTKSKKIHISQFKKRHYAVMYTYLQCCLLTCLTLSDETGDQLFLVGFYRQLWERLDRIIFYFPWMH